MPRLRRVSLVALTAITAVNLRAQCPDGTPRPCAAERLAAAPRRADPPLDDNTWIVVPFNNLTRAREVDWLRDASANLLYLDLSRWRDIRVVNDTRAADLIRQAPDARAMPLSLEAATAVARHAGAGRLVMGDVIKQGSRTTIVAKVFDVRGGALLRSPQQDLVVEDSLMPVFRRLARGILNLAPPAGPDAGIGTTRIDAYQEYLAGTQALNRFDLVPARAHLEQALRLDSTFALAHYKMAVLIGWNGGSDALGKVHAASAARLSGALPVREQTLIKAFNAFKQGDFGGACATYAPLVQADSNDVEALYGVGECSYHDTEAVPVPSDPTRFVFRGDWNTAIRVFERALRVEPTFHLAFQHILDILTSPTRLGSYRRSCPSPQLTTDCMYHAYVRRDRDSLVIVPVLYSVVAAYTEQEGAFFKTDARRNNLLAARDIAKSWVADAPEENRAHVALGHILTLLGDATGATREFAQIRGDVTELDAARVVLDRFEGALKRFEPDVARRLVDSVPTVTPLGSIKTSDMALLFGHAALHDSLWIAGMQRMVRSSAAVARTWPPLMVAQANVAFHAMLAGATPMVADGERTMFDSLAKGPPLNPSTNIRPIETILYALEMPRTWPAIARPSTGDQRGAAVAALSRGDTATFRAETMSYDSLVRSRPASIPDSGVGLFIAQAYLVLRDSVAALRVVRRMLDSTLAFSSLQETPIFGYGSPVLLIWPRLGLMRADLEAAVGDKAAARRWYKRFLDLWVDPDPDFAPIVSRARAAYAALAPPG